ncbi:MAG TPA: hypothetical protein VME42_20525 [Steroidobacteraceae bacterium]|nr:hypothetical protein [Steroidobacteraceae bacterium]
MALSACAAAIDSGQALAADRTAPEVLSAGVAKPLIAAQQAIRKKDWDAALADIEQAQGAAHKTDKDEYDIDDLLAYVLYRQNKYQQAIAAYEHLLESPLIPERQAAELGKTIPEMYFRLGDYQKAAQWAGKYLERHPDQQDMRNILGDSSFRMGEYRKAAATMQVAAAAAERAGQAPPESWLRIIDDSYFRLHDIQGMKHALVQLVRYYQRPEDWSELIDLYSENVHDERVALGYRWLMFDLGILKRPDDYEDLAFEALDADVPAEAVQALEQGRQEGLFSGANRVPGDYGHLLGLVEKRAAESQDSLPRRAAKAASSAQGQEDVLVGRVYLSEGQYQKAADALAQGLRKGGVSDADEAQLSLGIADLKLGRKAPADQAFQAVGKSSPWAGLAELWRLRLAAH